MCTWILLDLLMVWDDHLNFRSVFLQAQQSQLGVNKFFRSLGIAFIFKIALS